ncbi:MAG: nuclear transport factor 2 family protein [Pseudomonadota bacterium]
MQSTVAPVNESLAIWHEMIRSGDLSRLPDLLHPDAQFRSPMAYKPYRSAQAVALILTTVARVFEDFHYHREFISSNGLDVVLEFSARVGDKGLKGIDMIQFDADGRITDFEVMIRPFNALQALGGAMAERLGAILPAFKGTGG